MSAQEQLYTFKIGSEMVIGIGDGVCTLLLTDLQYCCCFELLSALKVEVVGPQIEANAKDIRKWNYM